MIYLDSSALVKRYVEEEGSAKVDALLTGGSITAVSRLASFTLEDL
jgi:predicted nucleic acid-binding protein